MPEVSAIGLPHTASPGVGEGGGWKLCEGSSRIDWCPAHRLELGLGLGLMLGFGIGLGLGLLLGLGLGVKPTVSSS